MIKTYADLLKFLQTLTPEQLQQQATVHLTGVVDFFTLNGFDIAAPDLGYDVEPGSVLLLVHDAN